MFSTHFGGHDSVLFIYLVSNRTAWWCNIWAFPWLDSALIYNSVGHRWITCPVNGVLIVKFHWCKLDTLGMSVIFLRVRLENQVCLLCRSPSPKAEGGWGVPSSHRVCGAQEICCTSKWGWRGEPWECETLVHTPSPKAALSPPLLYWDPLSSSELPEQDREPPRWADSVPRELCSKRMLSSALRARGTCGPGAGWQVANPFRPAWWKSGQVK